MSKKIFHYENRISAGEHRLKKLVRSSLSLEDHEVSRGRAITNVIPPMNFIHGKALTHLKQSNRAA